MSEVYVQTDDSNEHLFRVDVPSGWQATADSFETEAPGATKRMVEAANGQYGPVAVEAKGAEGTVVVEARGIELRLPDGSSVVHSFEHDLYAGVFQVETLFQRIGELIRREVGVLVAAVEPPPAPPTPPVPQPMPTPEPAPQQPTPESVPQQTAPEPVPQPATVAETPAEVGQGQDAVTVTVAPETPDPAAAQYGSPGSFSPRSLQ